MWQSAAGGWRGGPGARRSESSARALRVGLAVSSRLGRALLAAHRLREAEEEPQQRREPQQEKGLAQGGAAGTGCAEARGPSSPPPPPHAAAVLPNLLHGAVRAPSAPLSTFTPPFGRGGRAAAGAAAGAAISPSALPAHPRYNVRLQALRRARGTEARLRLCGGVANPPPLRTWERSPRPASSEALRRRSAAGHGPRMRLEVARDWHAC